MNTYKILSYTQTPIGLLIWGILMIGFTGLGNIKILAFLGVSLGIAFLTIDFYIYYKKKQDFKNKWRNHVNF
jgi:hypothetical protein